MGGLIIWYELRKFHRRNKLGIFIRHSPQHDCNELPLCIQHQASAQTAKDVVSKSVQDKVIPKATEIISIRFELFEKSLETRIDKKGKGLDEILGSISETKHSI